MVVRHVWASTTTLQQHLPSCNSTRPHALHVLCSPRQPHHSPQADKLGVPLMEEDRSHYLGLVNARISVSWDGRSIVAPPGVVDEQGMCDLEPYMPANFKKTPKKQQ